ncbi:MAG TPA: hypothetical protein VHK69_18810 [Chitinophagaceae bacterium]|nr:hypothetical protein [Chitinophagaceae bacterium]
MLRERKMLSWWRTNRNWIFLGFLALLYIFPVFESQAYLYSSFTDDFYYYLKIAKNFHAGKGLTFAEGYVTNGFHPLYQGLMIGLYSLSQALQLDALTFIRVVLGGIFLLSNVWLYRVVQPHGGRGHLLFYLAAMGYFFIAFYGMESLLIIPLLSYILIRLQEEHPQFGRIALLIVLAYLTRIDSCIISFPLFAFFVIRQYWFRQRAPWRIILYGLMVVVPVALICLGYRQYFGIYFPVSGLAKSAPSIKLFHTATFAAFFMFSFIYKAIVLFPLLITGVLLVKRSRTLLWVYLAAVALFYLQNAARSDWRIWEWYLYPFCILQFLNVALFRESGTSSDARARVFFKWAPAAMILVYIVFTIDFVYPKKVEALHEAGFRIGAFTRKYPGTYAMGDRAGIVGYVSDQKLIQLEGLVMNKEYLDNLYRTDSLQELLHQYDVRYYISTYARQLNDTTFEVSEPFQSRGYSKRIVDTISWPVLADFGLHKESWFKKKSSPIRNIIFKVPEEERGR